MDDDEITDGLIPILLPHLDIDKNDDFLLIVMDENGVRSEKSFATIQILNTNKIGQQQIGDVFDDGQQMRADYLIVVRIQAIGAKASQRIRNLRTALEYDSTGDKLSDVGMGHIDSSAPVDIDGEKNTLFEHRTVFDITLSACVGNFTITTYDAATDFGKLGRPLFDEEVTPVEKVTIIGDIFPDGNDDPIEVEINVPDDKFKNTLALVSDGNNTFGTTQNMPWQGEDKICIIIRYKPNSLTSSTYMFRNEDEMWFTFRPSSVDWNLHAGGFITTRTIAKPPTDEYTTDALVYDGVTMSVYRNGNTTPIASIAKTGTINTVGFRQMVWFAASDTPTGVFDGEMDDFWVITGDIDIDEDIPRIGAIVPPDPLTDPLADNIACYRMGDGPDDNDSQIVPIGGLSADKITLTDAKFTADVAK